MTTPQQRVVGRIRRRLLPFLFVLFVSAFLDRVNVSFAAQGLEQDLGMDTAAFGLGAGIFVWAMC